MSWLEANSRKDDRKLRVTLDRVRSDASQGAVHPDFANKCTAKKSRSVWYADLGQQLPAANGGLKRGRNMLFDARSQRADSLTVQFFDVTIHMLTD